MTHSCSACLACTWPAMSEKLQPLPDSIISLITICGKILSCQVQISSPATFMNLEESWPAFLVYTEEGMELVLGRGGATVSELDRHRLWDRRAGCGV